VGGWSADGTSFMITNQEVFAETIIPLFYKHNNIQSFVRQLNFYGFRKIKTWSTTCWEFRHAQFQRSKPEQIAEIKRSVHYAEPASSAQEVAELKNHVNTLYARLLSLENRLEQAGIFAAQQQSFSGPRPAPAVDAAQSNNKRRKTGGNQRQVRNKPTAYSMSEYENDADMADDFETSFGMALDDLSNMVTTPDPDLFLFSSSNPIAAGLGAAGVSASAPLDVVSNGSGRPLDAPSMSATQFSNKEDDYGGFGFAPEAFYRYKQPSIAANYGSMNLPAAVMDAKQLKDFKAREEEKEKAKGQLLGSSKFMLMASDDGSLPTPAHSVPIPSAEEIRGILSALSPDLYERFVDKLAEVVGQQKESQQRGELDVDMTFEDSGSRDGESKAHAFPPSQLPSFFPTRIVGMSTPD